MALPGLVAANNLSDAADREAVWGNLGAGIDAAIPTTNLLLRSEEIGTSPWYTFSATVTNNSIEAPDGTLTADTVTNTVIASDAFVRQNIANPLDSAIYAASVYLKQGTSPASSVSLNFEGSGGIGDSLVIDWNANNIYSAFGRLINISLISAGGGWFRVAFSLANNTGNPTLLLTIRAGDDLSTIGTVYAWGAQVQLAEEAGPYVRTTTVPVTASPTASIVVEGDDILELVGARIASVADFVRIKGLVTPAQPRLTTAAANAGSGIALRDDALVKASPSSEGDFFITRGTLDGQSLRVNGLGIASISGSPFSGSTASCPLSISSFAAPTNLRLNNAMTSGTLAFPEKAIPIETNDFILYAKAGQS
jgi:hypothetical protein